MPFGWFYDASFYILLFSIMKYIIVLSCIFLVSCFWIWWDDSSEAIGLTEIESEKFIISAPENWRILPWSEFPSPKTGEVALALASTSKKEDYINNLIVLELENTLWESSLWLMENTKLWLKAGLSSFALLRENDMTFADGDIGEVLTYRAKYSANTPEAVYIQTAKKCEDTTYFMTISLAEKLESYDRYEYLLSTFECK